MEEANKSRKLTKMLYSMFVMSLKETSSITPTVVGVYSDWPGSSALNLYI